MKDVYLTSTFTNQLNLDLSAKICSFLEKKNITCYLPYRDTNQKEVDLEIFSQDIYGIKNSAIILAIALNETPNWGAEIGYAYSIKKPIIVISNKNHVIPLICKEMTSEIIFVDDINITEDYLNLLIEKIKQYGNK
jgi:nucleoside 2-deoxyribosyltransferase